MVCAWLGRTDSDDDHMAVWWGGDVVFAPDVSRFSADFMGMTAANKVSREATNIGCKDHVSTPC